MSVRHADGERKWAHDRKSSSGRLDKVLEEATQKGWTLVDMKREWEADLPVRAVGSADA